MITPFGFIQTAAAPASDFMVATGGTITTDGDYKIHTFASDGSFDVTVGSNPTYGDTVQYLVVGGGGGAAGLSWGFYGSGGGGAGGYKAGTGKTVTTQTYSITVGLGGAGGAGSTANGQPGSNGSPGGDSTFDDITAKGGGYGGNASTGGGPGGSGGGAGGPTAGGTADGTCACGNNGGNGAGGSPYGGAGGGGATQVGVSGKSAAAGGNGASNSITGTSITYAGGGGGGMSGPGGTGGGGTGGAYASIGTNGTTGLGGGAGGSGNNDFAPFLTGASGGSGVVILRYKFQALYDLDAQAFFDRVTTAGGTLSTTEQGAVNTLVVQMKADGIWTKMKAIYPMVGASAAACAQNLKSSSFTGTFTAGWTFASTGVTPNGTSAYMDTGLIPNVDLLQDSSHLSVYITGTNTNNQIYIGGRGSDELVLNYILNFGYIAVNNRDRATTVDRAVGMYINSRTSSTNLLRIKNGVVGDTLVESSLGRHERPLWLGAYNNNNSVLFPSNNENAFASIGDGLTGTEASDFYTAVQAFQTSLSREV